MKKLKVGIMASDKFQQRVLDIAAGRYKPTSDEPKIWFSSLKSLGEVLNENNTRLLALIAKAKPASLKELAELSGRQSSNLSRTLKTFARYGIVELKKENKLFKIFTGDLFIRFSITICTVLAGMIMKSRLCFANSWMDNNIKLARFSQS